MSSRERAMILRDTVFQDRLFIKILQRFAHGEGSEALDREFVAALLDLEIALKWAADLARAQVQGEPPARHHALHITNTKGVPDELQRMDAVWLEHSLEAAAATCETLRLHFLTGESANAMIEKVRKLAGPPGGAP